MRFLKFFVVLMGVLIVLGFAFLGAEIYRRATHPAYRERWGERESVSAPFHIKLDVPLRSKADIAVVLSPTRFVLKAVLPTGETRFYIVDTQSGSVKGVVSSGGSTL